MQIIFSFAICIPDSTLVCYDKTDKRSKNLSSEQKSVIHQLMIYLYQTKIYRSLFSCLDEISSVAFFMPTLELLL